MTQITGELTNVQMKYIPDFNDHLTSLKGSPAEFFSVSFVLLVVKWLSKILHLNLKSLVVISSREKCMQLEPPARKGNRPLSQHKKLRA